MNINDLTASKIKEMRRKLGFTAESVAQDLGISKTAYSQLENGHVEITLTKIEAIAHLWAISLSELIPGVNSSHQVSNGSGDNFHTSSKTVNNFFERKDEANAYIIETLTGIINDLKKPEV